MRNLLRLMSLGLAIMGGGVCIMQHYPGERVSAREVEHARGGTCQGQGINMVCVCFNNGNSCNNGGCGTTSINQFVAGSFKPSPATMCDMNINCQAPQTLSTQNCAD